jgi:phosphatidylglycerophosphate synthase
MFMLLLLLLAMGWAVTRQEVACKTALITLWLLYTLIHLLLYVWKKVDYLIKVYKFRPKLL